MVHGSSGGRFQGIDRLVKTVDGWRTTYLHGQEWRPGSREDRNKRREREKKVSPVVSELV